MPAARQPGRVEVRAEKKARCSMKALTVTALRWRKS